MPKSVFIIITIVGVVCFSKGASSIAAGDKTKKLSLTEAVEMAVNQNFLIKEAQENQKGAMESKKSAQSEFFPKASATYSYSGLKETPYAVFGASQVDMDNKDHCYWDVTVTQPLFTGFALATKYKMADLGVETKQTEKSLAVLDVIKKVKTAYYHLLLAMKIAMVAEDSVINLKSHENDAEKFYEQGMIPYNDLLKSKVALADVVQNREKAKAGVTMAISALNVLLNRDVDEKIEVEDIQTIPSLADDLAKLIQEALENRPELQVLRFAIQNQKYGMKLAESSYYPQVFMVGRYEQVGDNMAATDNDFRNRFNSSITLQARWTFFEWGKTRYNVARYDYNRRSVIEKLKGVEDLIQLETKNAFVNLEVAQKNILTAKESLAQAKENWRITDLQYKQQITTSTEVLDARTFLTQADTNYYKALYGYMISLAELERAVGRK
jgi:outer membrane protein TolC